MSEVADLWVTLRANTAQFTGAMARAAAEAEGSGARIRKGVTGVGVAATAALVGVGVAAIKSGMDFQASMTRINSLALSGKGNIKQLEQGMYSLAGQVGFSPNSLAASLYHIESSFAGMHMSGKQALDAVRLAAQGAQVGGASLEDTTNAINAAISAGVTKAGNWQQAMGGLFATVGAGDMKMQDLNEAIGTGILVIGKQFGVSLADAGAALATFGDNNIRGAKAGTELRMAIMDLAGQSKKGTAVLAGLGLKAGQLGADMRRGGLVSAVQDLRQHLIDAKIPMDQWGQVAMEAFTKKSAAPLAILLGQTDRLKEKLQVMRDGIGGFSDAWKARMQTTQQKWEDFKASVEAGVTRMGVALLPFVNKVLGGLTKAMAWLSNHKDVMYALAGGVAALAAAGTGLAIFAVVTSPITAIIAAVFALGAGVTYAYEKFKPFHDLVNLVARTLKTVLGAAIGWITHSALPGLGRAWQAVWGVIQSIVNAIAGWVRSTFGGIGTFLQQHGQQLIQVTSAAWQVIWGLYTAYLKVILDLVKAVFTFILDGIIEPVFKLIVGLLKTSWATISGIFKTALDIILNTVGVILDLLTGHWGRALQDLQHLASQAWNDLKNLCVTFFGGLVHDFEQFGKNLIEGLVRGIKGAVGDAMNAVKSVGHGISSAFKAVTGIFSPSKVFHGYGNNIVQGLINGINELAPAAVKATEELAYNASQAALKFTRHKGVHHHRGHIKGVLAGQHHLISGLQDHLGSAIHSDTHRRASIAALARKDKTPAGINHELAMLSHLMTGEKTLLGVARKQQHAILKDPHATKGEKSRATHQVNQILEQLKLDSELRKKLLGEQQAAHKATAHAVRHQRGHKKGLAGDLPNMLEVMAAAGLVSGSGLGAHGGVIPPAHQEAASTLAAVLGVGGAATAAGAAGILRRNHHNAAAAAAAHAHHAVKHAAHAAHGATKHHTTAAEHAAKAAHATATGAHATAKAAHATAASGHATAKSAKALADTASKMAAQPIHVHLTVDSRVEIDKKEIGKAVQEYLLRHERRNTSNGTSRRRSAKV